MSSNNNNNIKVTGSTKVYVGDSTRSKEIERATKTTSKPKTTKN